MAISKDKKQALVKRFSDDLEQARMTVAATYAGVTVADLQQLRRTAREQGVKITVIKNRLVRVALEQSEVHKKADTSLLKGQLLYASSAEDEVVPAQVLATFAKTHDGVSLVAGFDASGASLDTAAVTALAALPSKDQLRGMLVGTIAAPLTQFLGVANGAQRGFAQVLSQRAEQVSA